MGAYEVTLYQHLKIIQKINAKDFIRITTSMKKGNMFLQVTECEEKLESNTQNLAI